MHEKQMCEYSCWITLTYSKKHLPADSGLDPTHFRDFMKRFRAKLGYMAMLKKLEPPKLRYYHCGEYGDNEAHPGVLGRPHYHACIFNWDFPDRTPWKKRNGHQTWRSPLLESLWKYGNSEIGSLTIQSASYVARYIMNKQNGDQADAKYLDVHTGVIKKAPYVTMSTKPGIGSSWFDKYHSEVYPLDEVISNGHKSRPPKYYDTKLKALNPSQHREMVSKRTANAKQYEGDNTKERLKVKEEVLEARTSTLKRHLE